MRPRDPARLASTRYDVLVVGGGVYGLSAAYEAAHRGLRTALVEAADFGGGASASHQTTAYGTLQLHPLARLRLPVAERRALARMAPWLLRPLPFLAGTYRSLTHGRLARRAAFRIEHVLTRGRNEGVEPELHLPATRLISKAATLRLFPGIAAEGLTGGAQWYEYQVTDSDRFLLALAAAAGRAGADLANYVQVRSPLREGRRAAGVHARDHLMGQDLEIRAGCVVNAAGAGIPTLLEAFGISREVPMRSTIGFVISRGASDMALVAPAGDGQVMAVVPWRGKAVVGPFQVSESRVGAGDPAAQIEAGIDAVNKAFPGLRLARDEITRVEHSRLPVVTRSGRRGGFAVLDHAADGIEGIYTLLGAEFIDARVAAERVAEIAARRLGRGLSPSRSASTTLPGAGIADHEALAIETARRIRLEVPASLVRHLITRYAEGAATILGLVAEGDDLVRPLAPDVDTIGAEVVHAVRDEMAVRLNDIVFRRTGLGAAGAPSEDALRACARIAAGELGWDLARESEEVAGVKREYQEAGRAGLAGRM
jgi:glycerol-3-phosphate dehydrogenase